MGRDFGEWMPPSQAEEHLILERKSSARFSLEHLDQASEGEKRAPGAGGSGAQEDIVCHVGPQVSNREIAIPSIHPGSRFNKFDQTIYERSSIDARNYFHARPSLVEVLAVPEKDAFAFLLNHKNKVDLWTPGSERGSGFVIDADGLVATSFHIVDQESSYAVKTMDGKWHQAELVSPANKANKDIAVLEIAKDACRGEKPFPPLDLGSSANLAQGDQIDAVGFADPKDEGLSRPFLSPGRFLKLTDSELVDDPKFKGGPLQVFDAGLLKLNVHEEDGDSGCPIFDKRQEVVGLQSSITKDRKYSYAAPAEDLKESLEAARKCKVRESGRFYYAR